MGGSKSAFLEAALLNEVLGGTNYVPPTTIYIALSTALFTAAATGSSLSEVLTSGTAYVRQSQANNITNWPAGTGSPYVKANGTEIIFDPVATADWGTVVSVYLVDAATDGEVLYGSDLATPVTVNVGSGFTIPVGQFVLSET